MYLMNTISMDDPGIPHAVAPPPVGPGFSEGEARSADTMEIWGTQFNDPGLDYVEFRLVKNGQTLLERRVDGY